VRKRNLDPYRVLRLRRSPGGVLCGRSRRGCSPRAIVLAFRSPRRDAYHLLARAYEPEISPPFAAGRTESDARRRLPLARLTLKPQKREFNRFFQAASSNAVETAVALARLLDEFPNDTDSLVRAVKEKEHAGDALTRDVVALLNRTFVTPIDRDDIYRLAGAIDDVCDRINDAASRIGRFGVEAIQPVALRQGELLVRATTKLEAAVANLHGFKASGVLLAELRVLEEEGDELLSEAVGTLFSGNVDPVDIIRWKDIHERLEDAVDACENAADVLEAIFVKNQ
jgi:predicted phosphate transport protein (TIGR00153 family)